MNMQYDIGRLVSGSIEEFFNQKLKLPKKHYFFEGAFLPSQFGEAHLSYLIQITEKERLITSVSKKKIVDEVCWPAFKELESGIKKRIFSKNHAGKKLYLGINAFDIHMPAAHYEIFHSSGYKCSNIIGVKRLDDDYFQILICVRYYWKWVKRSKK